MAALSGRPGNDCPPQAISADKRGSAASLRVGACDAARLQAIARDNALRLFPRLRA